MTSVHIYVHHCSMWSAHLYTLMPPADCGLGDSGAQECVRLVFTEQSESVKGSELSRSTSIKDRSQSGLTWPCHRHMAGHRCHGQILSIPPPPTPSSPSPPLRPRKRCFCQKPAALSTGGGMSLSLSLSLTYAFAYSLDCYTHAHKSSPTYFSTRILHLHFLPSSVSLSVTSTPLHLQPELPTMLSMSLLFLTAEYKHRAALLKLIGVHTVQAPDSSWESLFLNCSVLNPNHLTTNDERFHILSAVRGSQCTSECVIFTLTTSVNQNLRY